MKQWRHSYFGDYYIYDIINDKPITTNAQNNILKQARVSEYFVLNEVTVRLLRVKLSTVNGHQLVIN